MLIVLPCTYHAILQLVNILLGYFQLLLHSLLQVSVHYLLFAAFLVTAVLCTYVHIADICPGECYHRLKVALLLSLVGSGTNHEDHCGNGMFFLNHMVCYYQW